MPFVVRSTAGGGCSKAARLLCQLQVVYARMYVWCWAMDRDEVSA